MIFLFLLLSVLKMSESKYICTYQLCCWVKWNYVNPSTAIQFHNRHSKSKHRSFVLQKQTFSTFQCTLYKCIYKSYIDNQSVLSQHENLQSADHFASYSHKFNCYIFFFFFHPTNIHEIFFSIQIFELSYIYMSNLFMRCSLYRYISAGLLMIKCRSNEQEKNH